MIKELEKELELRTYKEVERTFGKKALSSAVWHYVKREGANKLLEKYGLPDNLRNIEQVAILATAGFAKDQICEKMQCTRANIATWKAQYRNHPNLIKYPHIDEALEKLKSRR